MIMIREHKITRHQLWQMAGNAKHIDKLHKAAHKETVTLAIACLSAIFLIPIVLSDNYTDLFRVIYYHVPQ